MREKGILTLDEPCPACAHQVSVLERLNPGGAYLTRVHRLNHFARAGQLVLHDRCLLVSCAVGWTLNKRMHCRCWSTGLAWALGSSCCEGPSAQLWLQQGLHCQLDKRPSHTAHTHRPLLPPASTGG